MSCVCVCVWVSFCVLRPISVRTPLVKSVDNNIHAVHISVYNSGVFELFTLSSAGNQFLLKVKPPPPLPSSLVVLSLLSSVRPWGK